MAAQISFLDLTALRQLHPHNSPTSLLNATRTFRGEWPTAAEASTKEEAFYALCCSLRRISNCRCFSARPGWRNGIDPRYGDGFLPGGLEWCVRYCHE